MEGQENNRQDLLDLQEFDEEALKKESEELLEMHFLTGENARFRRTEGGFVALTVKEAGEEKHSETEAGTREYDRVGVYLTFPLTNPEEFISIREADEKAKEIGIIEKLSQLEKDQQEMLREQIKLRYFRPVITKVLDVKEVENRPGTFEHRVQYINMDTEEREEIIKYIFDEERRTLRNQKRYQ